MHLASRVLNRFSCTLLLLSLLLPIPDASYAGSTITEKLYGPERFNYLSSTYTRTFSCPSTQGSFTLTVIDGDGNGNNTVSSAVIKINTTQIVGTNDFNTHTTQINKTVGNLVQGSNTFTVKINTSSPSSCLTVSISGVYTLDVHISSPLAGAQIHTPSTNVSGNYVSYSGNNTVKVNNTAATASSGTFTAANVPLVSGSNTLLATITTSDNLVDLDNVTINDNQPPIARAGSPQSARTGDTVVLDGRASSDPENVQMTWRWSLSTQPAESLSILHDNTTVSPWFIPDILGSYLAQLVVNDGVQDSTPDNVTVTASHPNSPPTAIAGNGISVNTGARVTLDGSTSYDADGDSITFSWVFIAIPQGSLVVLDNATTSHPSFLPDIDGAYIASLTVNDGLVDSTPDKVQVTAITPNAPPTANAGSDQTVPRNTLIHFYGPVLSTPSIMRFGLGGVSYLDQHPARPISTMRHLPRLAFWPTSSGITSCVSWSTTASRTARPIR
ncbi:MAG TPA: hypothetical protein VGK27_06195 [Candidatus Deferrimicrobiaceae bacterium]|jgi:hypothetical protein